MVHLDQNRHKLCCNNVGKLILEDSGEGTSSLRSGMSTAAGPTGLQLSHRVNSPGPVMTAGLKDGDGRVHSARIKFRNKLSN